MTIKKIKEKLIQLEGENKVDYEIGHRGGHYGLTRQEAFDLLQIPEKDQIEGNFPSKIGVYCNYLGGGLRGAIAAGGYSKDVPVEVAKKIDAFCAACKQRYEEIEKGWAEDPGAFTDEWTEEGTQKCREAGVVSAY